MDKETKDKFLRELVEEGYEKLYIFISRGNVDKDLVDDVVQETFLEAYRKAEILMDHENPMGWLYLTAKNKLMKLQSRKKSMYSLDDTKYFHFKAREIKEFKYGEIELAETIRNSVSEKEYEMLRDYYLNGYSSEEVAEKYGVDKGSIRMRMSRLKKRLREELIVGWLIFFVLCFRAVL